MEAPDVVNPSGTGATIATANCPNEESLRAVENDVVKKGKRLNYQNWEISAIIFGCHAACVAKPQSTV